jgi:hypothetical protein
MLVLSAIERGTEYHLRGIKRQTRLNDGKANEAHIGLEHDQYFVYFLSLCESIMDITLSTLQHCKLLSS